MPDISMCLNDACPSATRCYRHEAKPNEWRQSYAEFKPDETGKCEDFAPMDGMQSVLPDAQKGGDSDGLR